MKPVTRILVPTDFSDCSDAAAAMAMDLAGRLGASVEVVAVVDTTGLWADMGAALIIDQLREKLIGEARERVGKFASDKFAGLAGVTTQVREGSPWNEILEAAKATGADLLVMGTHGRTGLSHLLLGSVAEKVVRKSPIPVLTVRSTGK